ncbi:RsiV family protein [uncultured Halomonas sp.]|uniref:RsiV family protein n=1 Tax=uncultured Halomonas sp. TaxID=173971 RepID=UPI00260369C1|nr:RsiV family protein [uncultured Halomonas sp.]
MRKEDKLSSFNSIKVVKSLRSWSSSVSIVSAYLAIFTAFASVAAFTGNFVYDWARSVYWISEEGLSHEEAKALAGISSAVDIEDYELKFPKIETILPNHFLREVNEKIVSLSYSQISPNSRSHMVGYEVALSSDSILSFVLESFVFYEGALNPSESVFSFNIDMRNGHYIDILDIFRGGYQAIEAVKQIIHPYIYEKCSGVFEEAYFDEQFVPRFSLHDKHIEFIFSEYEVTPGVCGSFSVPVSYQEFSRLIDYSGPLADKAYPVGVWNAEEHRWGLLKKLVTHGGVEPDERD